MVEFFTAAETRELNEKSLIYSGRVECEVMNLRREMNRKPYQKLTFAPDGNFSDHPTLAGEYHVYLWRHMSGEVFYVGTGKKARVTSTLSRSDEFLAHLETKDIEVYVPYYNISSHISFKIERNLIKSLSFAQLPLANIIYNVYRDKRYKKDAHSA